MALCDGFEKIKKYYNNTDDDNKIVILFKSIGEKLHKNDTNTGNRHMIKLYNVFVFIIDLFLYLIVTISHDEDSLKPKLCQKCKINYVTDDEQCWNKPENNIGLDSIVTVLSLV